MRYNALPRFAGICSPGEAVRPGFSVEECVRRLKRYHYAFRRAHQILSARLTAEPVYELKMGFSYHAYLCAEHVTALRRRVAELREPPLHLDAVPDENLEILFDEILAAPDTVALVVGLYEKALPALAAAVARHTSETNRLADNPSVRICRFARLELADMIQFGAAAGAALVEPAQREALRGWLELLDRCLAAAGELDGAAAPAAQAVERQYSQTPFVYEREPRRDERFTDPYNMGVNTEAIIYAEDFPLHAKVLALFVKRYRELDVPEMMASIIVDSPDQPWEYYLDLSRQLWDEARHGLMGEAGLSSLEVDLARVLIPFVWSRALNTQLTPLERHGALYFIEQKLMARSGKKYEWEVALAAHDPLASLFQDYDWADEVLHARIGRTWYVSRFPNARAALDFGDRSSLKAVFDVQAWKEQGLTAHTNWWPDVYRAACRHWGIKPDPAVLAFALGYEQTGYSGPRFLENG